MSENPQILVIMGSVRKNRLCPEIAKWVARLGEEAVRGGVFEIVDLRDWPLSMDDESGIPAHSEYCSDATRAWSVKIAAAHAIVFVAPQYNWGYPAALKNAIDHLYHEWRDKPAAVISYGGHGGGKCAAQLHQVLSGVKMRLVSEMPGLVLPKAVIETNPGSIDASVAFADQDVVIRRALASLGALI